MSYAQFGYAAFTPTTQLMVGNTSTSSVSSPCCGGDSSGRSPAVESSATVCSLPATYDSRLLTTYHPRLYDHQAYPNFTGVESSAFYPSLSSAYGMKDATDPWRGIAPSASYYYDPSLAAYGYGGLDFNGARRKNVTRDSTSTLKAWLNEHRKNPYPTKGEKIMLAIITKMTLTQVSTWFANARRRLKKENKMTWEPRNKMDADDVKDFDDDDDADDDDDIKRTDRNERTDSDSRVPKCKSEGDGDRRTASCDESIDTAVHYSTSSSQIAGRPYPLLPPHQRHKLSSSQPLDNNHGARENVSLLPTSEFTTTDSSSSPNLPDIQALMRSSPMSGKDRANMDSLKNSSSPTAVDPSDNGTNKPKIWSLADTATSKSPPPPLLGAPHQEPMVDMLGHCGWFSVNPYQVSNASLGAYHSHASSSFATPGSSSHGFVPPQTDTPPQTPPNMKVSSSLSSNGFLSGQAGHMYHSATVGGSSANLHGSKINGSYPVNSGGRPYRLETSPEDYSTTGHFKTSPLQ